MTDALLNKCLKGLEVEFLEKGGIKERMHSARTGFRQMQDQEMERLRQLAEQQAAEIEHLKGLLEKHGIEAA